MTGWKRSLRTSTCESSGCTWDGTTRETPSPGRSSCRRQRSRTGFAIGRQESMIRPRVPSAATRCFVSRPRDDGFSKEKTDDEFEKALPEAEVDGVRPAAGSDDRRNRVRERGGKRQEAQALTMSVRFGDLAL